MAIDRKNEERIRELKDRRMRVAEEREAARKRVELGDAIVAKVNAALRVSLTLDDFETTTNLPIEFVQQPDFRDCPGLLAAHSSEPAMKEIASCCDATLSPMEGMIGFDEYSFLGTARVEAINLISLLELAKLIQDSVLFCPDGYDSIVLLDHYVAGGVPRDESFSLIVQGARLERVLARCFGN